MNIKYLFGLLIFLAVTLVPRPAHAVASQLVISELQTQSASSKTQEFIELHNPGSTDVVVTNWRVEYLTAGNNPTTPLIATLQGSVAAHGFVLLSKVGYLPQADGYFANGLSETGGHIRIVNAEGQEVDRLGWGVAVMPEGNATLVVEKAFTLRRESNTAMLYGDTDNNAQDFIAGVPDPVGGDLSEDAPSGPLPSQPPEPTCDGVEINEIVANPEGADVNGGEFIELINTSAKQIELVDCSLKTDKMNSYEFPTESFIAAHGYYKLALADKLLNAGGMVTLITSTTEHVVNYPSLSDNTSWANVSGKWQITAKATPGAANELVIATEPGKGGAVLTPCPAGKVRNPATNRCRSRVTQSAALMPCKMGTVRNPITNRCRSVVLATTSLVPCQTGQVRNPATNRCRKVVTASASLVPCKEGYARNAETNRCRKDVPVAASHTTTASTSSVNSAPLFNWTLLLVAGGAVAAYCIYEYRHDVAIWFNKVRSAIGGKAK